MKIRQRLLVVILALAIFLANASTLSASAWDFHGIDMTGIDSVDTYTMSLDLNKLNHETLIDGAEFAKELGISLGMSGSKKYEVSIVFTFNNIKYNGQVLYIVANETLTFNGALRPSVSLKPVTMSLSNNYYKWLIQEERDYSNITISIMRNGIAKKIYWNKYLTPLKLVVTGSYADYSLPKSAVKYDVVETGSGIFNPDDDDFDIDGGNSGTNTTPDPNIDTSEDLKSGWQKLVELFMQAIIFFDNTSNISFSDAETLLAAILLGFAAITLYKFLRR